MPKYAVVFLVAALVGLVACQKSPNQPTYQVFYYDIDKPSELHPLGETTGVSFGYTYDFKGIKGEKLGILWQGELHNTQKDGLIVQHGDKLSLKINGQEVKLSHEPFTELPLEKGNHPIEIRYEPKWHAGEAVLNFLPKNEVANLDNLPKALSMKDDDAIVFAEIDNQYIGIGVDLNTGNKIEQTLATNTLKDSTLTLSSHIDEQTLILSSPKPLNVEVIPNGVKIKAIIATSDVGNIRGVDGVPIYRLPYDWETDWWASNCDCTGGTMLSCSTDEGSYPDINDFAKLLNGQSPKLWYHQELGWQSFDEIKTLYGQAMQELVEAQAYCGGEESPSFDNYSPNMPSADDVDMESVSNTSWLSRLQVVPPEKGFVAYYFNRDDMNMPVATDNVSHIAINYHDEDLHNIPAEQFAVGWAGYITVNKDTMMSMQYDLSWGQLRVFLNGKQVYQVRNEGDHFDLLIPKGKNRLDVEYINHWHTVGFAMHPQPKLDEYPQDKAEELVNNPAYDVVSVSVYESGNRDNTIPVALPNVQKPVVLILDSYHAVFWQLPSNVRIQAIIVEDGKGMVLDAIAPVIRVKNLPYSKNSYYHFYEYWTTQVQSHQYKKIGD